MLADKEDIVEKMDLHEELPAPTFAQRPSRAASWSWEYCAEVDGITWKPNNNTNFKQSQLWGHPNCENAWSDATRTTANPFATVEEVQLRKSFSWTAER